MSCILPTRWGTSAAPRRPSIDSAVLRVLACAASGSPVALGSDLCGFQSPPAALVNVSVVIDVVSEQIGVWEFFLNGQSIGTNYPEAAAPYQLVLDNWTAGGGAVTFPPGTLVTLTGVPAQNSAIAEPGFHVQLFTDTGLSPEANFYGPIIDEGVSYQLLAIEL